MYSLTPSNQGLLTLRALRLLRVLSFLRLERSYNALKNLRTILAKKKEELGLVTYMTAVIVLTSSITMYVLDIVVIAIQNYHHLDFYIYI